MFPDHEFKSLRAGILGRKALGLRGGDPRRHRSTKHRDARSQQRPPSHLVGHSRLPNTCFSSVLRVRQSRATNIIIRHSAKEPVAACFMSRRRRPNDPRNGLATLSPHTAVTLSREGVHEYPGKCRNQSPARRRVRLRRMTSSASASRSRPPASISCWARQAMLPMPEGNSPAFIAFCAGAGVPVRRADLHGPRPRRHDRHAERGARQRAALDQAVVPRARHRHGRRARRRSAPGSRSARARAPSACRRRSSRCRPPAK